MFRVIKESYVKNRSITVRAARREQIVIIGLAVWMAFSLKEVSSSQFLIAVRTGEVLRVPGLSQSSDDLANKTLN